MYQGYVKIMFLISGYLFSTRARQPVLLVLKANFFEADK